MKVAIHQPNFIPWLGFFHKALCADCFVLLDDVPFTKRGYQNRTQIKGAQGPRWLTVPVETKGKFGQSTLEVKIDNSTPWAEKMLSTFKFDYGRAPFYREASELIAPLLLPKRERLVELTAPIIELLFEALEIPARIVYASSFEKQGASSRHLANLVTAVGGDTYLSGPSGKNYMDETVFADAGIALEYTAFQHPQYPQINGDFAPGLSIFDALCNLGVSGVRTLLRTCGTQ